MAKRGFRRAKRIYSRAKGGYRSRKGLLSGNVGNVVIGAIAGSVSPFIPEFLGGWTKPVIFGAGGYLLKKPALLTIAGYEAGKNVSAMFLGGTSSNVPDGGFI